MKNKPIRVVFYLDFGGVSPYFCSNDGLLCGSVCMPDIDDFIKRRDAEEAPNHTKEKE